MTNENQTSVAGEATGQTPSNTTLGTGSPSVVWAPSASANPRGLRQKLAQLLEGLQTGVPEDASIHLRGQLLDKSGVEAQLGAALAVFQAASAAQMAAKAARAQLEAQAQALNGLYHGIADGFVAYFGRDNPLLEQLGIPVSQPARPLTPEQNVVRATKARKTRELRHTMGKRQKAKLQYRGSLDVSVTETVAPASPAEPVDGVASTGE